MAELLQSAFVFVGSVIFLLVLFWIFFLLVKNSQK